MSAPVGSCRLLSVTARYPAGTRGTVFVVNIFGNSAKRQMRRRALSAAASLQRGDMPASLLPPARKPANRWVSDRDAMGLGPVYRALDILTGAVGQLGLDVTRQGQALPAGQRPAVIRNPSMHVDRRTFIEQTVLSLAVHGDFFWWADRHPNGMTTLDVINPAEVHVELKEDGTRSFHWRGGEHSDWNIIHRAFIMPAGAAHGIGPIQAAQEDLRSAIDVRDYAANYFNDSGQPAGVLTSEQAILGDEARAARNRWNGLDDDGTQITDAAGNPSRIKVLGKGMSYSPILVSPKDAQWLESRNFSVVEVARLFGVPSSLMLASIDGNSQTYQNVEQDWLGFVRFTLAKYLGKIEDALTEVTANGQTVRFNVETLLRSDTLTRYQAHQLALTNGWMTVDEVREIEALPPLTDSQRASQAAPSTTSAPVEA